MCRFSWCAAVAALLACTASGGAATFSFLGDPFAGSDALTNPGRDIVGGEDFIVFSPATDMFLLDATTFGISEILFANDEIGNLPTSGANTIVLRTFDNDSDPTTPFLAGTAANIIASRITTPGPGFFVYFNSNLDLPRLVYSTDLSDNTADLRILFRMTNLSGQAGRDTMAQFTADNFALTPEPSSFLLLLSGGLLLGLGAIERWRQRG